MSGNDVLIENLFGLICAIIRLAGVSNSTDKKNHLVDLPLDLGLDMGIEATFLSFAFCLANPQVQGFSLVS